MNKRMNRARLNIGAYILRDYARTEQHIADLAASGVEFVVCMENDRPALDLFEKYGVGAIVTGVVPGWWGGDGHNAGKLAEQNPLCKYDEAAATFTDHPAIWGIDVGDEPSALDFPHYGKVMNRVNALFPNQFAYLNLYPNYASVAQNNATETVNQLGTATYAEHIERYCQCAPVDYLCYDFYLYSAGVPKHYENLKIVADACRQTGRSLWIVLQVNSQRPEVWLTENNLRFQAWTSMAFGVENIIWACYTAGWWHHQILDDKGEKTEQYDKMTNVNREIRALADEYMRYRNVSTHFIGFAENHPDMAAVAQDSMDALDTGVFYHVKADGMPVVCGQMAARNGDGSVALFVAAADDPKDVAPKTTELTFGLMDGWNVQVYSGSGKKQLRKLKDGQYAVTISSNEGILITAR